MAASLPQTEAFPEKNTFIHFGEPNEIGLPPLNSAPGTLLGKSFRTKSIVLEQEFEAQEQPTKENQSSLFRRLVRSHLRKGEDGRSLADPAASPMQVQLKSTHLHVEDPLAPHGPPAFSALDKTAFSAPPVSAGSHDVLGSAESLAASMLSSGDQVVVAHTAPHHTSAQVPDAVACEGTFQLSSAATCHAAGLPSLGSEGHCTGQCIPCLMQVRWQA
eukprot:CAMPEP_0115298696 /NCGR_PEP_ID=MMETSP0270-20121206/68394_1 /TAXON_ID=71861 /ORGANISM="Scrippsiella trochoidea, Strain CCMP3099" /LENGTH=216 /DNA_ID=CAMNT_0002716387 /DNA_START=28 /DNA_END=674 /DNA_ORIENTATION=+